MRIQANLVADRFIVTVNLLALFRAFDGTERGGWCHNYFPKARIPLRVCLGTRHGFLIERAAIAAEQRPPPHAPLRAAKLANIIQNTTTSADCARHRTIYS